MLSLVTFTVARLFSLLSVLFRFGLIKNNTNKQFNQNKHF